MKSRHVVIVGGGASGLVAAITAARHGAKVTIVEQKERLGKKILSTGNGRCNLTNAYMDLSCFYGDDTTIVSKVLEQFGYADTVSFFESLGVLLKDRQGYVYPLSDQAATILDILCLEIQRLQIKVLLEEIVLETSKTKKGFMIKTSRQTLYSDALILATGGKAASALGSDGSGYNLAKHYGHHLSPVVPALVQLRGKGNFFKQLSGIRTQATVTLLINGEKKASDTGELQLTNYGISGIPVFQISRFASKGLYASEHVSAEVDFLPSISEEHFEHFLRKRIALHGERSAETFCIGMLHQKLIGVLLKIARIPNQLPAKEMTERQIELFIKLVKHFVVEVEDTNGFEQAQVCAGGVKTSEVSFDTMESRLEPNLYLTGELLDIDGICGGYNLQWAWSTGYIAGKCAAKGI